MSDAFLFRWNYAGDNPLSNCIGVSVSNVKVAKTTGIRPNVPIIRYYTVHLQEIRPQGARVMGFAREIRLRCRNR